MKKLTKDQEIQTLRGDKMRLNNRIIEITETIHRRDSQIESLKTQNGAYSRQLALYIDQAADYAKNVMTMVEEGKQKDACIRELCRQVGK